MVYVHKDGITDIEISRNRKIIMKLVKLLFLIISLLLGLTACVTFPPEAQPTLEPLPTYTQSINPALTSAKRDGVWLEAAWCL